METIIILGSLLFISLVALLILNAKIRALKNHVKKLAAAYSKIEILMSSKTKLDNDAHQESFIKFLSDSRDSAFDYIQEVQSGISDFVSEVDPVINYFDEYGDIMGMIPNYDGMKKMSVEFKKLKKLLPKESE
jgi:predicted nucleotide-binding protein (sugar kinase/HSP70/actin superfamily)